MEAMFIHAIDMKSLFCSVISEYISDYHDSVRSQVLEFKVPIMCNHPKSALYFMLYFPRKALHIPIFLVLLTL